MAITGMRKVYQIICVQRVGPVYALQYMPILISLPTQQVVHTPLLPHKGGEVGYKPFAISPCGKTCTSLTERIWEPEQRKVHVLEMHLIKVELELV